MLLPPPASTKASSTTAAAAEGAGATAAAALFCRINMKSRKTPSAWNLLALGVFDEMRGNVCRCCLRAAVKLRTNCLSF